MYLLKTLQPVMHAKSTQKQLAKSGDTAADSSNCSSKKGLRGQISPPENDEIEAARIRMEAYLAKKIGSKKN